MVAITGLGLSAFVLMHMAGNMLILFSAEKYNLYGHAIVQNALLYPAEVILLALFVVHMGLAIQLALENKQARPISPGAMPMASEKTASFASRSMILTGLLTSVFVVIHLITFKWGTYYEVTYHGITVRDLHRLVLEKFREPLYTAWYLLALTVLGVHLSHGFSATFQSLGLASIKNRRLKRLGWTFAILVTAGFISQPLYAILCGGS